MVFSFHNSERGQALLVTMLYVSGLILSATAIAGLLVTYQIRQAVDAATSAQAIMAADAAIERSLYCYFFELRSGEQEVSRCNQAGTLGNGATYSSTLSGTVTDGVLTDFTVHARGAQGKAVRFLEDLHVLR